MDASRRIREIGGHLRGGGANMSTIQAELEKALDQGVKDGKIPHAVVYATNRDGSFQYHYATGYQNLGKDDTPIKEDAVFMLASQTKLLTSIAALQVVEQGFIALDDDVSPHIPELSANGILKGFDDNDKAIVKPVTKKITLRHLLSHSSGATYPMLPDIIKHQQQKGQWGAHVEKAGKIVDRYTCAMVSEPGEGWMYSTGLDWTGLLIHRLTGLDLEGWMQKNLFPKLGIENITFWPQKREDLKSKIPQLTSRNSDGDLLPNNDDTLNTHSTECYGGHGAYAQLGDYIKVLHSLLANDGKILKPETVDEMFSPQLGEGSKAAYNGFLKHWHTMLIGEVTEGIEGDYGLGGGLWLQDDVGRRRKGTMHWGGFYNPFWMIDREAGLALTFGTQVIPPGDSGCKEMTGVFERAVYKMAGVEK